MECQEVKKRLGALFDGELAGEECEQVKQHLSQCQACQAELQVLKRLSEVSRESPVFEPNEGYWSRLPDRIAAQLPLKPAVSFWDRIIAITKNWGMVYRLAGVVATAVVIFVVVRNVMMPGTEKMPQSTSSLKDEFSLSARGSSSLQTFGAEGMERKSTKAKKTPSVIISQKEIADSDQQIKLVPEAKEEKPLTTLDSNLDNLQPLQVSVPLGLDSSRSHADVTRADYASNHSFELRRTLTDTISAMHEALKLCQVKDMNKGEVARVFFNAIGQQRSRVPSKALKTVSQDLATPKPREASIVEAADLYSQLVISQRITELQPLALLFYQKEKKTLVDSLGNEHYESLLRQLQQVEK